MSLKPIALDNEEVPDSSQANGELRQRLQFAAVSALEQNLTKFSDMLYAKYSKKQEEKLRKKKQKEASQGYDQYGNPIPLNVDNFLQGNPSLPQQPILMNNGSSFLDNAVSLQQPQMPRLERAASLLTGKHIPDLDYKRPKIDVYLIGNIFNQCANPMEHEDLRD